MLIVALAFLVGLAWTGLNGGFNLLAPSHTRGQKVQAYAQMAFGFFALLSAVTRLSAQSRPGPAAGILGTWHGTSICVDRARDTACHDEEVIYQVDSAAGPAGPVRMVADKVVDGARESMGELRLHYDTTTRAWSAELRARFHMRWSFEPKGDDMSGTLIELPSGRLIRRVAVRRTS